jgi:hypothetical protein
MTEESLRRRIVELEGQLQAHGIAPSTPADLPDEFETATLLNLVSAYQCLKVPTEGEALREYEDHFLRAIRFCNNVRRQDSPNTSYALGYWIDTAEEWLRRLGVYPTSLDALPFVAAMIVSRIPYAPLTRFPHDLAWGAVVGELSTPRAWWRQTLAENKLPPPVQIAQYQRPERIQEISIFGGNEQVGASLPGWARD